MTLSDISIKNPVFAWMLMAALIVFGSIGFSRMGISQLPDVDYPVLTITVTWPGADPETMESGIADVIEDAVMGVAGIRNVSSVSREGTTGITLEFDLDRDIDVALQEVQTRVLQAQKNLPSDIDPAVVSKSNPEDNPILYTALSGTASLRDMTLFARDHMKDLVTTTEGVGDVRLSGYVDPNMRVWLDRDRMNMRQLTVDDIITSIANQHALSPSGYMAGDRRESNVRVLSEARTAAEFGDIIISSRRGEPIWIPLRLKDVAAVEEGLADIRRISRTDGRLAVGLGVIKQRGANAVEVGRRVKERIAAVRGLLPPGMTMGVVFDATRFVEDSTRELFFTLCMSVLLTSLVCFLFLGSFSSAFNVILAIPTALVGSFIVLYFLGFTLNTFTLLALSLSIGIVVDDAIMVMENIVRYFEGGMSRVRAAIVGAREITPAAVAASLAILAIFLPVIFMKGIIGRFFFQFGVTMSVAVMFSLLEALTLAPMRCSQMLRTGKETALGSFMDRFMAYLSERYRAGLAWCLDRRGRVLGAAVLFFCLSLSLLIGMTKEFVPPQDQGRFIVNIQTGMGSSIEYTDALSKQAEAILSARPEVKAYMAAVGGFQGGLVNQGSISVTLHDFDKRPFAAPFKKRPTQQQFMAFIRKQVQAIPGMTRVTVMDLSLAGFTAKRGFPVQFSIQGPDRGTLAGLSEKLMEGMNGSGLVTDVDTDYKPGMPEIRIVPDRVKAAARGVTVTGIADTISAAVGSLRTGRYTDMAGHRSDVRVKLRDVDNRDVDDIRRLLVRNIHGELVSLGDVVRIERHSSLLTITRYNRERAIGIFANIAPGKSQADVITSIERMAARLLPPGYHIEFTGSSETFRESFDSLMLALVLGIIVAYMILGSQFNSFIHPFVILLALPFSVTGAFIALRLTGMSLNIYSMIGLLLLMGIVKKNSILLVDFTNRRRIAGMDAHAALLDACPVRLRPILMTSLSTIAAAIPPALSLGPGAETTRPMAVVVIGGVILSTLLTLFVVPCAYSVLAPFESTRHRDALKEALEESPSVPL